MKTKKAQTDIIVTVLIVLIALAAVAFVATFIMNTVRSNTARGESQAQCTRIDLGIARAVAGDGNVSITRNDNLNLAGATLKVLVNGAVWNSSTTFPNTLETTKYTNYTGIGATQLTGTMLATGQSVEVAVVLADGTVCPSRAKAIVA